MNRFTNRLRCLGMKQVDFVPLLREKGHKLDPSLLSDVISGARTHPKALDMLADFERLLDEFERDADRKNGNR